MIIGLIGKKQVGKDTVGKILQYLSLPEDVFNKNTSTIVADLLQHNSCAANTANYKIKKFAEKLKQIVCLLIGCTREQLEDEEFKNTELGEEWTVYQAIQHGNSTDTVVSIHLRRIEAEYIRAFSHTNYVETRVLTPRLLLQLLGTEFGRNLIHPNIWVNALMQEYKNEYHDENHCSVGVERHQEACMPSWIITDVRFPNEVKAIEERGGILIRVENSKLVKSDDVHESETALDNYSTIFTIHNNGTIEELVEEVRKVAKQTGVLAWC